MKLEKGEFYRWNPYRYKNGGYILQYTHSKLKNITRNNHNTPQAERKIRHYFKVIMPATKLFNIGDQYWIQDSNKALEINLIKI